MEPGSPSRGSQAAVAIFVFYKPVRSLRVPFSALQPWKSSSASRRACPITFFDVPCFEALLNRVPETLDGGSKAVKMFRMQKPHVHVGREILYLGDRQVLRQ